MHLAGNMLFSDPRTTSGRGSGALVIDRVPALGRGGDALLQRLRLSSQIPSSGIQAPSGVLGFYFVFFEDVVRGGAAVPLFAGMVRSGLASCSASI